MKGLHVLIDVSRTSFSHEELARLALEGGAKIIQLRDKTASTSELLPIARALRLLTRAYTAIFIVNDRVDIAIAAEADGVHLGQDDLAARDVRRLLPNAIIGVSTGCVEEAVQAEKDGANYIGFGHMFPTDSKLKSTPQRTLDELRAVSDVVTLPVIAIGGINRHNVAVLLGAGASGIAIISAISNASDPTDATRAFIRAIEDYNDA